LGDVERAPIGLGMFGIRLHFGQRDRHHRISIIRAIVLVILAGYRCCRCGGRGLLEGRGGRGGRGVGGFHGRDLTQVQQQ